MPAEPEIDAWVAGCRCYPFLLSNRVYARLVVFYGLIMCTFMYRQLEYYV